MPDYLNEQQTKFENAAELFMKEANEVLRELSRQLILVATVFLSVSAFVFYVRDIFQRFKIYNKWMLISFWILTGLSLLFGIVQIILDSYFFSKWASVNQEIVEDIANEKIKKENLFQEAIKRQQKIPRTSSAICMWIQIITLFLGIFIIVFLMSRAILLS